MPTKQLDLLSSEPPSFDIYVGSMLFKASVDSRTDSRGEFKVMKFHRA